MKTKIILMFTDRFRNDHFHPRTGQHTEMMRERADGTKLCSALVTDRHRLSTMATV
jgi:hypothetical protein